MIFSDNLMGDYPPVLECFKKKISREKFKDWLSCHNIYDEGEIHQAINDFQYRGYNIEKLMPLISGGEV